jgi:hypothetical protein
MTLIETKTLGTAVASIVFTSIPQDGTDLLALMSTRSTESTGITTIELRPNSQTANRSTRVIQGDGASTSSFGQSIIGILLPAATATSNTFGSTSVHIMNYSASGNKSMSIDNVTENNGTTAAQRLITGGWFDSTAITSLEFIVTANTLAVGSSISLYKITKGSSGGVVVS